MNSMHTFTPPCSELPHSPRNNTYSMHAICSRFSSRESMFLVQVLQFYDTCHSSLCPAPSLFLQVCILSLESRKCDMVRKNVTACCFSFRPPFLFLTSDILMYLPALVVTKIVDLRKRSPIFRHKIQLFNKN